MPERARSRRSARCPIRIGYRLRAALASRAPREFPPNDVEFAMCSNDPASEPASFCLPAIDETCKPKFLHALDGARSPCRAWSKAADGPRSDAQALGQLLSPTSYASAAYIRRFRCAKANHAADRLADRRPRDQFQMRKVGRRLSESGAGQRRVALTGSSQRLRRGRDKR